MHYYGGGGGGGVEGRTWQPSTVKNFNNRQTVQLGMTESCYFLIITTFSYIFLDIEICF